MVSSCEVPATDTFGPDVLADRGSPLAAPAAALDVIVRWDDWVLAAHELSPPRPFFAGEHNAEVVLPQEILGARRLPLVLTRWDGQVHLVVPKNARLLLGGQTKRLTAARLVARGLARPSSTLADVVEVPFLPGQTATLFLDKIAIDFAFSTPAPRIGRQPFLEKRIVWSQTASLALHAVLLGILFFFIGPAEVDLNYGMTAEQLDEFQRRLWRLERLEMRLRWELDGYESRAQRDRFGFGPEQAAQKQAWMDSLDAAANRWTQEAEAEAGRHEVPENDDRSLLGVLYDWPKPPPPPKRRPTIDDVMKMSSGPEDQSKRSARRSPVPSVRMGATSVSGRLPPEVIQRIVRQNFGHFRLCYENGLRNNPNLQGRVAVRFVIGRDGATSNIGNGGSDMPDSRVVRCVMQQFQNLEFPSPEGGIVTVIYPIIFSPPG